MVTVVLVFVSLVEGSGVYLGCWNLSKQRACMLKVHGVVSHVYEKYTSRAV